MHCGCGNVSDSCSVSPFRSSVGLRTYGPENRKETARWGVLWVKRPTDFLNFQTRKAQWEVRVGVVRIEGLYTAWSKTCTMSNICTPKVLCTVKSYDSKENGEKMHTQMFGSEATPAQAPSIHYNVPVAPFLPQLCTG